MSTRQMLRHGSIWLSFFGILQLGGCMTGAGIPGATSTLTCPLPENKGCKPIIDVYRSSPASASASSSARLPTVTDPAALQPPAYSAQPTVRAVPRAISHQEQVPTAGAHHALSASQNAGPTSAQSSMVAYRDAPNSGLPVRSAPRMLRIWIAPYEDADGALRDQGYYYVMIDAGRWNLEHNQKRIMNAFAPTKGPKAAPSTTSGLPTAPGALPPGAMAASQVRQALRDVLPAGAALPSSDAPTATSPDDQEGSQ